MNIKESLSKNKAAAAFIILATVCELLALLLYLVAGTNKFSTKLSALTITLFIVCIVLGILYLVICMLFGKSFTLLAFAQYAIGLYAFAEYIVTQLGLISNVMYGIMNPGSGDGNSFGIAMIVTVIASLLAWVFALIAGVIVRKKEKHELESEGV
jgi:hypothetical protein